MKSRWFDSSTPTPRRRSGGVIAAGVLVLTLGSVSFSGVAAASPAVPTLSFFAGTGTSGAPTPGPATASALGAPVDTTSDSAGNLYIADATGHRVEKVTPQGTLSIFAGTGSNALPVAGPAVSSPLKEPEGVAADSTGDVFISDTLGCEILKVNPAGTLSIFAGTGTCGPPTPGPALSSNLGGPDEIAVDPGGDVYIGDSIAHVVEMVTPAGVLSVVVGTGSAGAPIPGPATGSPVEGPAGVALDSSGDLYVTDDASYIYKVTPAGTLSIVAGTGNNAPVTPGPAVNSNFVGLTGLNVDRAGNLYVSDGAGNVVCKITLSGTLSIVAGTGTGGPPTAGPPTSSDLHFPGAASLDAAGNLYIADAFNARVEEITGIVPGPPVTVQAAASGSTVTVNWAPPTSGPAPTGYTVTPVVDGVPGTPVVVTGTSYVLKGAIPGATYTFIVAATNVNGLGQPVTSNAVLIPSSGYWTVAGDGGVFSFGPAFYGSTGSLKLNQPVFAITSTSDGKGYWFVARDGGVFAYGDGAFHGSVPALGVHVTDIVGMVADTATGGYWLVGSDGGVYAFGAPFDGSVPELGQHVSNIVGMVATADGGGYYLVSSTGAVDAFGDANYQGGANTMAHLNAPIVGISVDSATGGYWLAGSDGGIYAYGAPFEGSAGTINLNAPVVGISATMSGSGYYLVAADGGILSYDAPFLGSMGGKHLNAPMVGVAAAG